LQDGPNFGSSLSGISGSILSVTKSGASVQILSGTNTYSGLTTVSGGQLLGGAGGSSSNSAWTVASGGTNGVQLAAGDNTKSFYVAGLTNKSGSGLAFDANGNALSTSIAPLQVLGTVLVTNPVIYVQNTSDPLAPGDYPLVTASGALGIYGTSTNINATLQAGATANLFVSGNTLNLRVKKATTTTTVSSSAAGGSTYGQNVTFTATVATNGTTATAATGNVVFKVDGSTVATVGLSSGLASYSTASLTVPTHSVTAEYAGDNQYTASTNSPALTQTVAKATPALTLTASGITYGQTLASSTVGSSTATNSFNLANVTGTFAFADNTIAPNAGSTNVTVNFTPGDPANYNNASGTVAVAVAKATPALTAPTASAITVGQTLASSTLSGGAATNTFNLASVPGTFAFADNTIAPIAGTTNVTVNFTPGDPANYNSASTTVTVTVNSATTTFNLISSTSGTNGYHDSVSFMVTNLPSGAGSNVVFSANGTAFSTNNVVNGGTTSLAITNLPRGSNYIVAIYNGDGTYLAGTNTLAQYVTNHVPVAAPVTVLRTAGTRLNLRWSELATNWSDADGDAVMNVGINLVSTNGITLLTNATVIVYTNSPNVNDQFSYTISDGQGGTNTGLVNIVINPFSAGQAITGQASTNSPTGPFTVKYYGIIGYTYQLQRNTNLVSGTGWKDISTNTIGSSGYTNVVDDFSDLGGIPASAYYRVGWHP
jgi:Bacterial Ig-like domain (group 3)/Passenger-associated-transport-repeat/Cadherin-like domain